MGNKKGMQNLKKIYPVVMKLNRFFALHVFENDLYQKLGFKFKRFKS